jgi:hypothetical protein
MKRFVLFVFSILLTTSFASCVNEGNDKVDKNPDNCECRVNDINSDTDKYNNDLAKECSNYLESLTDEKIKEWFESGQECYEKYLWDYGQDKNN